MARGMRSALARVALATSMAALVGGVSAAPSAARRLYLPEYSGTLFVGCKNTATCLELNIPGGFDSAFWKADGYKYNLHEHPECAYARCDRGTYPTQDSVVHDVSGFTGVTLTKFGKPGQVASQKQREPAAKQGQAGFLRGPVAMQW